MKATILLIMISLISLCKAQAIEFIVGSEPETYTVTIVKYKLWANSYHYGIDAEGKVRLATFSRGDYGSPIYSNYYQTFNSEGKSLYISDPFSLSDIDHSQFLSGMKSTERGCSLAISVERKKHRVRKVIQTCPKKIQPSK